MSRLRVFWLGVAGCVVGSAAVLGLLAWSWLPSQQEASIRVANAFAERTGVQVDLGSVRWSLWPAPTLVVEDAVTRQANPLVVRNIRLQGSWSSLLHRAPRVELAELEGVVVSRAALAEFAAARKQPQDGGDPPFAMAAALHDVQVSFRDLTWVDQRHTELAYDGEVDFDTDGLPRMLEVARAGASPQARMKLDRQGDQRRWNVGINVAGGSWNGEAELKDEPGAKGGRMRLDAALTPRDIDVAALAATFRRHSVIAGRAGGETRLEARGERWVDLLRSLHTHTRFVMKPARLNGFDLGRAVSGAGVDAKGQTPLDQLTGVVETRNTGRGIEFRYTDLKAKSGVLDATGKVRLLGGKLDGELAVDIVDGVVGVPVVLSGTVQQPVITPSAGALTGAAVGSAVLPGVGTALGARLGHQIERLFEDDANAAGKKAPAKAGNMGEPPSAERGPAR